jgi:hypothetical protein
VGESSVDLCRVVYDYCMRLRHRERVIVTELPCDARDGCMGFEAF